ncbi:diguanylate cyclase [Desulfovibrio inopinatus]|uniref:diguanylate cyclase n=1 Tax=Desulfovibrio inopinatus TaxID=102109 RepID=UPI000487557E|nr:diguanylate cyclase [Desulfovibrio inopinatus]
MKLRTKLPLFLIPIVIGPLFIVSWMAFQRMRVNAEDNILRQMTSLTQQIAVNIETIEKTTEANALLFSGSGLLKAFLFTPDEDRYYFALLPLVNLFSSYHNAYQDYEEIRVILPDGYEAARFSVSRAPHSTDTVEDRAWFQQMQHAKTSTMSFFQWNPDSGEPTLVVAHRLLFVDPTFEDSTAIPPSLRGYLVITVRLESLQELVVNTRIGNEGGILILDERGRLLYPGVKRMNVAEPKKLLALAASAAEQGRTLRYQEDDDVLLIQARSLPGGLMLVGYLPEKELTHAGQELGRVVLVIGSIAVLLATALLMLVLHSIIVKPLARLGAGAEAIGGGKLETRLAVHGHDEVSQLASQFNAMAESLVESRTLRDEAQAEALRLKEASIESLRAADRLKDEFLANTSHELRTPLHGIIGLAESMMKGVAGPLPEHARENLSLIIASGRRLTNLVNDILDFSKLRHKALKLALRPVDLKSACDLVLSMVSVIAKPKDLALYNHVPDDIPAVMADENRLHQILYNLVGNAVKFTSEGWVKVSARVEDTIVSIDVADTGMGIPEDQRETVFQSFEQLDRGLERAGTGTGLGLAITRQLVVSHGGTIEVVEREGGGSIFRFTMPRAPHGGRVNENGDILPESQKLAVFQPVESSRQLAEKEIGFGEAPSSNTLEKHVSPPQAYAERILVVDDEPVNLRVIENYLQLSGYQVYTETSGADALSFLESRKENIDLVLLDVMMPGQTGYQVCEQIRQMYRYDQLPVLFLTALTRDGDLEQGFLAGGNDYIPKPFSYAELLARIRLHLALSHQAKELHTLNAELEQRVAERTQALQWAYADMERLASLDGLTGVHNRRSLDQSLDDAWKTSIQEDSSLYYLIMDVDHFKAYNDIYGHQAGDACLRALARELTLLATHYSGFLGRYGGEEFSLILVGHSDESVVKVSEAIMNAVHSLELPHTGSSTGMLTLSLGIAARNASMRAAHELVAAADTALYKAKNSGRNKAVFFEFEYGAN